MCNKSESIKNIAVALAKFNGEISKIEKDAKNPHFKNNYASLDNIIDEVRPILTRHGLSILQMPGGDGEMFTMTTMLLHESGEWIESQPIVMRPVKNDPQGIGSCATYARRYSLAAFLSLNTGDDDDGNGASGKTVTPMPVKLIGDIKTEWLKKGYQLNQLDAQCAKLYNGSKLSNLSQEQAQDFLDRLTGKKEVG